MDTLPHLDAILTAIRMVLAESEKETQLKTFDGHNLRAMLRDMYDRVSSRKTMIVRKVETMEPLTESERSLVYHGEVLATIQLYKDRTGSGMIESRNRVDYERAQM